MRISIILILSIKIVFCFSQTCESYNLKLFHDLPESPDKINCKDSIGQKQGWWIYYSKHYNPIVSLDELDTGEYVPSYSYGQYKDNRKIGIWRTINNVHHIYEINVEGYWYSNDTIMVTSWHQPGQDLSTIYYNADSTKIKSLSVTHDGMDTICIKCDKNTEKVNEVCEMTYRNIQIKTFSFDEFEMELEKSFIYYQREKKLIDYKYR
jgi:hypothetical protein